MFLCQFLVSLTNIGLYASLFGHIPEWFTVSQTCLFFAILSASLSCLCVEVFSSFRGGGMPTFLCLECCFCLFHPLPPSFCSWNYSHFSESRAWIFPCRLPKWKWTFPFGILIVLALFFLVGFSHFILLVVCAYEHVMAWIISHLF